MLLRNWTLRKRGKGVAVEKEKGEKTSRNNQNGHNVESQNRYAALSVDADIEVSVEEEAAKSIHDEICNKGLFVSIEERCG